MSDPTYRLLLRLAGEVDDDLLATGRELVAVGDEGHALELLVAELVATGAALPAAVRAELVAEATARRVQPDAGRHLRPDTVPDDRTPHRFTGDGDPAPVRAALAGVAPPEDGWTLCWRVTPAGAAPGPLPHPVLLARCAGDGVAEVLTYRAQSAVHRAGIAASVEVRGDDDPDTPYHRAARAVAVPVAVPDGDVGAGTTGPLPVLDRAAPVPPATGGGGPDAPLPVGTGAVPDGATDPAAPAGRHAEHPPAGPAAVVGTVVPDDALGGPTGPQPVVRPFTGTAPTGAPHDGRSTDDTPDPSAMPSLDRGAGPGSPAPAVPTDRVDPVADGADGAAPGTAPDTAPDTDLGTRSTDEPAAQPDTDLATRPYDEPAAQPHDERAAQPDTAPTAQHDTAPAARPDSALVAGVDTASDPTPDATPDPGPGPGPGPGPDRAPAATGTTPDAATGPDTPGPGPDGPAPGPYPRGRAHGPDGGPPAGDLPSSTGAGPAPGAGTFDDGAHGTAPGLRTGPAEGAGARPDGPEGNGGLGPYAADRPAGDRQPEPAGPPEHPAPRPSPPIRALRESTAGDWFGPDGDATPQADAPPGVVRTDAGSPGQGRPPSAIPRNGTSAGGPLGRAPVGPPAVPAAEEQAWQQDWMSGAWAGDPGPPASPHGAEIDAPTPPPGVPIVQAPPVRSTGDAEHRPRHLLLTEDEPPAPDGPPRAADHDGPAPQHGAGPDGAARHDGSAPHDGSAWHNGVVPHDRPAPHDEAAPHDGSARHDEAAPHDRPAPHDEVALRDGSAPHDAAVPDTGDVPPAPAGPGAADPAPTRHPDRPTPTPTPTPTPRAPGRRPSPTDDADARDRSGSIGDRLSPTEHDLLQRLHEELAARESGGEPTPRNGTVRPDRS